LPAETATGAQIVLLYRKRVDVENVFDELKNQWGFSGFCSHKAVVSETAARLLFIPAKLVQGGRQKALKLAVGDKCGGQPFIKATKASSAV
jgi:hypothetical protein